MRLCGDFFPAPSIRMIAGACRGGAVAGADEQHVEWQPARAQRYETLRSACVRKPTNTPSMRLSNSRFTLRFGKASLHDGASHCAGMPRRLDDTARRKSKLT